MFFVYILILLSSKSSSSAFSISTLSSRQPKPLLRRFMDCSSHLSKRNCRMTGINYILFVAASYFSAAFLNLHSCNKNQITIEFGTLLLLNEECEAGRLHGCLRWLTMQCNENRFLPFLSDRPTLRPLPPVHYLGKSSANIVFSALVLLLHTMCVQQSGTKAR